MTNEYVVYKLNENLFTIKCEFGFAVEIIDWEIRVSVTTEAARHCKQGQSGDFAKGFQ